MGSPIVGFLVVKVFRWSFYSPLSNMYCLSTIYLFVECTLKFRRVDLVMFVFCTLKAYGVLLLLFDYIFSLLLFSYLLISFELRIMVVDTP